MYLRLAFCSAMQRKVDQRREFQKSRRNSTASSRRCLSQHSVVRKLSMWEDGGGGSWQLRVWINQRLNNRKCYIIFLMRVNGLIALSIVIPIIPSLNSQLTVICLHCSAWRRGKRRSPSHKDRLEIIDWIPLSAIHSRSSTTDEMQEMINCPFLVCWEVFLSQRKNSKAWNFILFSRCFLLISGNSRRADTMHLNSLVIPIPAKCPLSRCRDHNLTAS